MAIVISRKTGEVQQAPAYTQEQKDAAWEALVRGWASSHGDMLKNLSAEANKRPEHLIGTYER